jgi:putative transposase
MAEISYRRHRFPPIVIQHAVWLYLRFTLSYRDVEELLAERGLDISYESVRSWVLKFGPMIARRLRQVRPRPSDRWHLDGVSRTHLRRMKVWRCTRDEGGPLDAGGQAQASNHCKLLSSASIAARAWCNPAALSSSRKPPRI